MGGIISRIIRFFATFWALKHVINGNAIIIADMGDEIQGFTGSRITPERLRRIISGYNKMLGGNLAYGKN